MIAMKKNTPQEFNRVLESTPFIRSLILSLQSINERFTIIQNLINNISYSSGNVPQQHDFVDQSEVLVTHNYGYKPKGIQVFDDNNMLAIAGIQHIDNNSFRVIMNPSASGFILF